MRTLIITSILGALLWLLIIAALGLGLSAVHAGTTSKAPSIAKALPPTGNFPDAECTYDVSGDVYISPDGAFWECICERRTFIEDDCAWYNQGPINRAETRKIKLRLHLSFVPHLRVISL